WDFENWSGDIQSENKTITITMDSNKEITTLFKEKEENNLKIEKIEMIDTVQELQKVDFTVKINNEGHSLQEDNLVVSINNTEYHNETISLNKKENAEIGLEFEVIQNTDYEVSVKIQDENKNKTLNVDIPEYDIVIHSTDKNIIEEKSETYLKGESFTLTVDNPVHYGWIYDNKITDNEELNITVNKNLDFYPIFEEELLNHNVENRGNWNLINNLNSDEELTVNIEEFGVKSSNISASEDINKNIALQINEVDNSNTLINSQNKIRSMLNDFIIHKIYNIELSDKENST
ncbi:MAG: hypothetical protein ACOCP8_07470, partial [archaeon]